MTTDFMAYCLKQYYRSSGWNEANQYSNLCSWSRSILDFQILGGLSSVITKLPPSNSPWASHATPAMYGTIGYMYTSKPFDIKSNAAVGFQSQIDSFSIVAKQHTSPYPDYLFYGRMFVPGAKLEAMYVRRVSDTLQYVVSAVNMSRTYVSPQIAMHVQNDVGRWCSECSYTVHDGVFGVRTLYNFCSNQWSVGGEVYLSDKRKGMSAGVRYRTLPTSANMPICFTCSWDPIKENISTTCTSRVSNKLSVSSRYDFSITHRGNKSDVTLGFELKNNDLRSCTGTEDGVFKAKWSYLNGLGFLWENRFKNILFSFGVAVDLTNTHPFRTVGIEVHYVH